MTDPIPARPGEDNDFQGGHVARLLASFARVTGGDLAREAGLDPARLGESAWNGNFALLSHSPDAILTYANRFALGLWEMDWDTMLRTPSVLTAPPEDRAERAAILAAVERDGFTRGYSGRRVSRGGLLFRIEQATVWRLVDEKGAGFGTGAFFHAVSYL